jgi:hypothetical protein
MLHGLTLLVATGATSAATADTLDLLIFAEFLFWHTANARAVEVGLLGLNATQAAELE